MSYLGISIKEAVDKINREWFLPAIQRPYVWGSRYNSERFICRLFDSLYREYPIGTFIFWETDNTVAHREFLSDYHQGDLYKNVDEGLWKRSKNLIYDGQQRLQTLYSCLKYSFNDRLLVFDLRYNRNNDEDGETGFRFVDKGQALNPSEIKMNELFSMKSDTATKRDLIKKKSIDLSEKECILVEENIDQLWTIIVKTDAKTLAYFTVQTDNEDEVNDVFERLNTGGIPLSKADLLFYKIKAKHYDFEAELMEFSSQLKTRTKLAFSSYDILQLIHLIVKGQSRINENITDNDIENFYNVWKKLPIALNSFFDDYLVKRFHITHIAIIRYKNPLLVLMVFFYKLYNGGSKYLKISDEVLKTVDRFFITSQLNSWDLQTYTDRFARIVIANTDPMTFPENEIVAYVRERANRDIDIKEAVYRNNMWFSLKITFPNRDFEFDYSMPNRFNPELDHIFPLHLKGMDVEYRHDVDIIWNMQPIKGVVNNDKSSHHPKLFFTDSVDNGKQLYGKKYYEDYDCIPPVSSNDWDDYKLFLKNRRKKMIQVLNDRYGISIVTDIPSTMN